MSRRLRVVAVAVGVVLAGAAADTQAQEFGLAPCGGAGVPPGEPGGYVPLPRGEIFCSLLADPKDAHSFASYQTGLSSGPLGTDIAAVGVGDSFGLFRISGSTPGNGLQLNLAGSVFAQFDLNAPSLDLINADYLLALPLTVRFSGFSARARVYHQSSHLGDEFLLRGDLERENLSFESAELLLSQELGLWRVYGGGEYLFNREPETLESTILHAGAEFRQVGPLLRVGSLGSVRLLAGVDGKFSEEQNWSPAVSARAGFEVGRARELDLPSRHWSLLLEAYRGPTPYGQFYRDNFSFVGIGFHFGV